MTRPAPDLAATNRWSPTGGCDGIKLDVNDMLRARANALRAKP